MKKRILKTAFRMSRDALLGLLVCCLFAHLGMAENSSAQSIEDVFVDISAENNTVENIFGDIENATSFSFLYGKYRIDAMPHRISFSAKKRSVADLLRIVSRETGLHFRQINSTITVKAADIQPIQTEEQVQEKIEGTVSDAQSGETLPGVNVLVKGTTIGASTDTEGAFELSVPSLQDTLVVSFIGYQTREIPINGRTEIDIQLPPEVIIGEEMVVVGYGEQEAEDVTSALSQISSEEITKRSSRNIVSSLQGLSAGVTVTDHGGEPGAANTNIRIRGVTTLGNNNPLFIVDGVEQSSYNDIDPNNIESITVLEDASSTAIYGSRAANGVILIETKRGTSGDIQVSYNGKIDFQNLATVPEHLGTEDYLRLQNIAYENRGSAPPYSEEDIENYVSGENRLEYPAPNTWFDTVIQDNAPMLRNSLSVSGGGERISTYGSFSHFDQQGIYPNRSVQKYILTLNNDIYITDKISLKADLRLRRNDRFTTNGIGQGLYHNMTHGSQFTVPQYPDGTYDLSAQGHNPLAYADSDIAGGSDRRINTTMANIEGTWDIIDGLTFSSRFAVENEDFSRLRNYPTYEILDRDNPEVVLKDRQINSLEEVRRESEQTTWYSTINYAVDLNNHTVDLLGGYSQETYDFKGVNASGRDLYNNDLRDMGQTESESRDLSSSYEDWGLRSFFSRINYNFKSRYLIQFNMRYDGSSRFPEDNRYTFFPSASAGWRISEEPFWEPFRAIVNEFKLRASWGETGNQNVGLYTYYDNLAVYPNGYVFNDHPQVGVVQNNVTSEDLTWETTTQTNFGLDLSFLENKYTATFDWYKKNTEGILLTLPIAGVVGLNPASTNAGSVQNIGWAVELKHRNTIDDFFYSISLNLADVKNEITDLAGTGPYYSGRFDIFIREEGSPIDALWGYETDGVLTEEDIANNYPVYASDAQPGDIKYVDRNEDGILNSEDRKIMGSSIPRLEYGSNIELGWRQFNLNLQLQGVGKRDIMLWGAFIEGGSWEGFTIEKAGDYWSEDNPDARFPRPQKQTSKNTQPSDWWVVDGSYLRLKNLQLTYNLPGSVIERVGVQTANVFIGGTNLLTFSNLNEWGVDAEAPPGRADYYPPVKTYTVGLNINF